MSIPVDSSGRYQVATNAPSLHEPEADQPKSDGSQPQANHAAKPEAAAQSQNTLGLWAQSVFGNLFGARDSQIDQQEVDLAVRVCRMDPPGRSVLADVLRNPKLNEAERNLVIQKLAREPGQQERFYANDLARTNHGDPTALSADHETIANAVQNAYQDGAINADDLAHIADTKQRSVDANQLGNGAQRFMSILGESEAANRPGGAAEALADKMWARKGEAGADDRAVAAMYYTSDPALMARKLDTPKARAEAFDALVNFADADPYKGMPSGSGPNATRWKQDAISAAGRLFVAHSQELIDQYTTVGQTGVHTEPLAKFLSQTVFNPDAQGIVLDRQRDLVPTVRQTLGNAAQTYLERAKNAPDAIERADAARQFGRMTAALGGGASKALTDHSDQVNANEQARQEFADMVGSVVGMTFQVAGPIGDAIQEAAKHATKEALKDVIKDPQRPDGDLAYRLADVYQVQVDKLSRELRDPGVLTAWEAAAGYESSQSHPNLVNPGGREEPAYS